MLTRLTQFDEVKNDHDRTMNHLRITINKKFYFLKIRELQKEKI